jgi:hypothetical protein
METKHLSAWYLIVCSFIFWNLSFDQNVIFHIFIKGHDKKLTVFLSSFVYNVMIPAYWCQILLTVSNN